MRRPPSSLLLAIDTATALTGLALFDGGVIAELVWHCERNQTVELLPALVSLLNQQGWTIDDLSGVAVSLGPGSFNGLRVGLGTAKGLCLARDLPCVGVETLRAAALPYVNADQAIRPVYDAGRGEVATALYRPVDGALRQLEPAALVPLPDLPERIAERTLVCGEVHADWIELLSRQVGHAVSFPSSASLVRRPSFVAELGWQRLQSGDRDDQATLQPIYLRRPAITPSKRS